MIMVLNYPLINHLKLKKFILTLI